MRKKLTVLCLATLIGFYLTGISAASLTTSFTMDGQLGAEVAAFPASYALSASGTLSLSSIPAGATIVKAVLYGNNYFNSLPLTPSAIFNGNPLGSTSAFSTNGNFSAYKWDVTSLVTGNGPYAASYSGLSNSYGLALAVVFSDASLPFGRVSINDGAIDLSPQYLGPPVTASTTFTGFSGPGTLWLHTAADNDGVSFPGESGEQISLNGTVVGGPIDANLGNYASLFNLPVTAINGVNTAAIFDPSDNFGWDLAVLTTPSGGPVPVPPSLLLLGSGLLGLAGWRRFRKS